MVACRSGKCLEDRRPGYGFLDRWISSDDSMDSGFAVGADPLRVFRVFNPFLPTRHRSTVVHSLVAGGAQSQWLQVCLPDGRKAQCLFSPYPDELGGL